MPRILVIEDNPASLDLMVYLLEAFGHTALRARDGLQGIETTRKERPDLILCDVQLPGADGHDVCRELKGDPSVSNIPLVAVTAYAMVGDREKLLAEGFNGYISKPINPQSFMDQVAPFFPAEPQRENGSAESAPADNRISPREGKILVVDNSPVNLELSKSVLEPFGYTIITARSVNEAIELLKQEKPFLIMSDIHMPERDGFDFIEIVKSDPAISNIPFIFISSTLWGNQERARALSLGADRFIVRPIEPLKLVAEIDSCRKSREPAK